MLAISEEISIIASCVFGVSLISTIFLIPVINKIGIRFELIDKPNKRKVHKANIVRIGGLGILIGYFVGSLALIFINNYFNFTEINHKIFLLSILGSLGYFFIGFFDDIYNYSPFKRLLLQIILSSILFANGLQIKVISISWINSNFENIILNNFFSYCFVIVWIVGLTNALNWIDGLDGLAAGITTIIIITFCCFYISNESWDILFLSLALCGSIIGFLRYNIYPAKILMGDGGSYLLGSNLGIASLLGITNNEQYFGLINNQINQNFNTLSIALALIIMLIPVADMTFVILNRITNRRSPFYPDKTHFHHKLLKFGFHPRKTVIIFYGIQFSLSCIAILISGLEAKVFYICLALIFILLSFLYIFNMKNILGDKSRNI